MLVQTIHDLPAFGNTSGQKTKGKVGCVTCMDKTASRYLTHSRKTVYMRHRRFLRKNHPYRKRKAQFDNTVETGGPPPHKSGAMVFAMVKDLKVVLGKNGPKKTVIDKKQVFKKKSVFWNLPYWEDLDVRHSIDVMHVEKNVCESILGTLLKIKGKTKDGYKARMDMQAIRPDSELEPENRGEDKWWLKLALYNFTKQETIEVLEFLQSLKTPSSSYCANIRNLVDMPNKKLTGMKSHDCHVMLTQILPIAIRNALPKDVRNTLIHLCDFFNKIWKKVIDPEELDIMQKDIILTLCELEMFFPPSFFDVTVHLIVHLVDEIKYCGPVFLRNMYPFERFMGILKHYCRNRYRPEASIVEGYTAEEVVEFCTEYMQQQPIGVPLSKHEGRLAGVGSASVGHHPPREMVDKAHLTVLNHMTVVHPFITKHRRKLEKDFPGASEEKITKEHNKKFAKWLEEKCADLPMENNVSWLARKPSMTVQKYQAYDINANTFYTEERDSKTAYQNSSVLVEALTTNNVKEFFYGTIEEIWELNYVEFKQTLFKCKWAPKNVVTRDEYGRTSVYLNRMIPTQEPFILASQATQIWYAKDLAHKNQHVVMHGQRRILGVENVVDEDRYNQFDDLPTVGEHMQNQEAADRIIIEQPSCAREDCTDGHMYNRYNPE